MSTLLHFFALAVIVSSFFIELSEIEELTFITVWGFLFIAAIISGLKVTHNIMIPKDVFDDRNN